MSQKTIILTAVLFALIVIGMFVFARIRNTELQQTINGASAFLTESVFVTL